MSTVSPGSGTGPRGRITDRDRRIPRPKSGSWRVAATQNGKVERFNRTLQIEWAYRQVFLSNDERSAALAPWVELYTTRRLHTALGGISPISRL